jgi:hypothetical protein
MAAMAAVEVLLLGALCSIVLLSSEKDFTLKIVTAVGLGAGLTGLIVIALGFLEVSTSYH